jgi:phenylacetate-CoA ligase
MCLPGGGLSSAARLEMMLDNRATVLCCTPTYAIRLGEVAEERGLQMHKNSVRVIIVAGEPGAGIPSTRARIEKLWPEARIRDHHGMTEVGPVTFECPQRQGVLHVMESGYIPEVIDPDSGTHASEGELVLTNLGRTGSPLIRYRTGDLVKCAVKTPCACGRHDLALEGGILGRIDDMVVVRGVNIFPSAIEDIVRRFEQVAEYRVELWTDRALPELNLQLEPIANCTDPDRLAQDVQVALRAAFHLRIPISLVAPGELPRFELKARRWVHMQQEQRSG